MRSYFVVLDGFETVPEVTRVADEVPANLFTVQTKVCQEIIVSLFHGFQFFLGGFFSVGEREYAGDFCSHVFEEGSIELSVDVVLLLEFFGVPDELEVADGVDLDLIELELQAHALLKYIPFTII